MKMIRSAHFYFGNIIKQRVAYTRKWPPNFSSIDEKLCKLPCPQGNVNGDADTHDTEHQLQ